MKKFISICMVLFITMTSIPVGAFELSKSNSDIDTNSSISTFDELNPWQDSKLYFRGVLLLI